MNIELGLLIAFFAVVIAYLGYSLNRTKSIREDGQNTAVINTKLDNIERGVESIRIDIKANERRVSELAEKHVRIEESFYRIDESLKLAHKRLDKLEDKQ